MEAENRTASRKAERLVIENGNFFWEMKSRRNSLAWVQVQRLSKRAAKARWNCFKLALGRPGEEERADCCRSQPVKRLSSLNAKRNREAVAPNAERERSDI